MRLTSLFLNPKQPLQSLFHAHTLSNAKQPSGDIFINAQHYYYLSREILLLLLAATIDINNEHDTKFLFSIWNNQFLSLQNYTKLQHVLSHLVNSQLPASDCFLFFSEKLFASVLKAFNNSSTNNSVENLGFKVDNLNIRNKIIQFWEELLKININVEDHVNNRNRWINKSTNSSNFAENFSFFENYFLSEFPQKSLSPFDKKEISSWIQTGNLLDSFIETEANNYRVNPLFAHDFTAPFVPLLSKHVTDFDNFSIVHSFYSNFKEIIKSFQERLEFQQINFHIIRSSPINCCLHKLASEQFNYIEAALDDDHYFFDFLIFSGFRLEFDATAKLAIAFSNNQTEEIKFLNQAPYSLFGRLFGVNFDQPLSYGVIPFVHFIYLPKI